MGLLFYSTMVYSSQFLQCMTHRNFSLSWNMHILCKFVFISLFIQLLIYFFKFWILHNLCICFNIQNSTQGKGQCCCLQSKGHLCAMPSLCMGTGLHPECSISNSALCWENSERCPKHLGLYTHGGRPTWRSWLSEPFWN